jgi:hypothetical protein
MADTGDSDIRIYTEQDLKKRTANDDYWRNKQVDDAIFRLVAGAVYGVGVLAALALGYFIWYYAWGPDKDPAMLVKAAGGVLIYISGIVTPTIKATLRKRRRR